MTRTEAELFLARNPRLRSLLLERHAGFPLDKLDQWFEPWAAENEEDARVNLVEVARAMER